MNTTADQLISVVIPCYNQAHYLGEALASVQQQRGALVEIIVVDDGSQDETVKVSGTFARVHCLRQPNRGLSAARNAGLRRSLGEFIVFLDADDRLLPDALMTGLNALRTRPECVLAYGHVKLIDAAGKPLPDPQQTDVQSEHYAALLRGNFIWTPGAVMYRRQSVTQANGFRLGIDAAADYDLHLRLARHAPICCHGQTVLEYRRHDRNMSAQWSVMLRACVIALQAQRPAIAQHPQWQTAWREGLKEMRRGYGDKLVRAVRQHWRARAWTQALRDWRVLLRYHPRGAVKALLPERWWSGVRRWQTRAACFWEAGL